MADHPKLTAHEFRLLQLIADGKTDRQIAAELHFHPRTVKGHINKLAQALQARGRTNLIARAFRLGLMPAEAEPVLVEEATRG